MPRLYGPIGTGFRREIASPFLYRDKERKMDIEELIRLLESPGEEDVIPDTIYDDLRGAYAALADTSAADEMGATIARLEAEIERLTGVNRELMDSKPVVIEDEDDDGIPDPIDGDTITIDDLFED